MDEVKLPNSVALQENGKIILVNEKGEAKKVYQFPNRYWFDEERKPMKFRSSNDGSYIWAFFLQGSNRNFHRIACVVRNNMITDIHTRQFEDSHYPKGLEERWKRFWVDNDGNLCLFTTNIKKGDTKVPSLMISPSLKIIPSRDVKIDYESTISITDQEWAASPHSSILYGREYRLKQINGIPKSGGSPFGSSENVWNINELSWYPIESNEDDEGIYDLESLEDFRIEQEVYAKEVLRKLDAEYTGENIELDPREVTSWEEAEKFYDNE